MEINITKGFLLWIHLVCVKEVIRPSPIFALLFISFRRLANQLYTFNAVTRSNSDSLQPEELKKESICHKTKYREVLHATSSGLNLTRIMIQELQFAIFCMSFKQTKQLRSQNSVSNNTFCIPMKENNQIPETNMVTLLNSLKAQHLQYKPRRVANTKHLVFL